MLRFYVFNDEQKIKEFSDISEMESNEKDIIWVHSDSKSDLNIIKDRFDIHNATINYINTEKDSHDFYYYDSHYYNFKINIYKFSNSDTLESSILHVIFSDNFIITVLEGEGKDLINFAIQRFSSIASLNKKKPIVAVCMVLDNIISSYFPITATLDDMADDMESNILDDLDSNRNHYVKSIYSLKVTVRELRLGILPIRELMVNLSHIKYTEESKSNLFYVSDITARVNQILVIIEQIRDVLSGNMDIYMAAKSNKLNEIMKLLTILSSFFMPITFITGFWGMNFLKMPGLKSPMGFVVTVIIIAITPALMYLYFKKKKWV